MYFFYVCVFRCWEWAQVTWRETCSPSTCCWLIVTSIYLGRVKSYAVAFIYVVLEVRFVPVTYIDFRVCNICTILITDLLWCTLAGAADKPYNVEDAISYNELDYLSVSFTTRPDYFFMIVHRLKCCSVFDLPAPIPHFVINKRVNSTSKFGIFWNPVAWCLSR